MNLREWMHKEYLTHAEAGERLGVSQQNISRWLAGKGMPSLPVAMKVWEASGKAIAMDSWISLVTVRKPAKGKR